MRCDNRDIGVVRHKGTIHGIPDAIVAVLSVPGYALLAAPGDVLTSGSMRRRLDFRPEPCNKTSYAAGIDFHPDHGAERVARNCGNEVEALGIGGGIDQKIAGSELVEDRRRRARGFLP